MHPLRNISHPLCMRYDYEGVEKAGAEAMIIYLFICMCI